ncbi:hypothetical protein PVL29_024232 [Vitis rotundifolia]|uniref:non-specific serine/threonine protein kinase n=1 Tax=Vitis rotundifolia TaxID=103349 RepID=A0AA39DAJ5_VITRO|nr:hypothetical protein PVL29_024232 [Vitis rotundifolia]
MKKHLQFSLLILLLFQIILYCSMNRVGAVDADTDTLALLSFKSVVSDSQNVLSGWNLNSSHCTWFGVTCANNGTRVQSLHLAGYGLSGTIHPRLSNLTCLQLLDLYNNSFYNQLQLDFSHLSLLQNINLARNSINGTIPVGLCHCYNLEEIYFKHHQLIGNIPSELGDLSRLRILDVAVNNLTGFSSNHFQGSVPLLGNMNNSLRFLHLGLDNLFSTTKLNLQVFNSLANCTQLELLYLNDNQLAGKLPTSVANLSTHLLEFCISNNFLTGSIPQGFERFQNLLALDICQNLFTGNDAKCQNLKRRSKTEQAQCLERLEVLDACNNQLSRNISTTIGSCLSLHTFNIATNKLSGSIPVSMGKLIALESLDLSSNSLTGGIPEELEDLLYLQILNLSFKGLEGSVPRKGVFMNLTWLSHTGNSKLCGSDPEAAGKLRIPTCMKVKSNRHLILKIVIPVASFALLMCAACITWTLIPQNKKYRRGTSFSSPLFKVLLPKISYSDIQLATNDFSAENLVIDLLQGEASENFDAECEVLRNIRHRNLVKVITSCSSIDKRRVEFKALVMEFTSNGNLEKWLYPEDTDSGLALTLIQRLNIAIDVASALDYLHHDSDPPVVHCDLKPANVLLDDNMEAHVGDFGLARFLWKNPSEDESSTIGLKGLIGYIAPECGLGSRISTSRDVYSFGILLLEIFTAKKPTDEMFQEGLDQHKLASALFNNDACTDYSIFTSSSGDFNSIINSSNTLSHWQIKTEECITAIVHVGLSCAAHSTTDRLIMREALTKLHDIKAFLLDL